MIWSHVSDIVTTILFRIGIRRLRVWTHAHKHGELAVFDTEYRFSYSIFVAAFWNFFYQQIVWSSIFVY